MLAGEFKCVCALARARTTQFRAQTLECWPTAKWSARGSQPPPPPLANLGRRKAPQSDFYIHRRAGRKCRAPPTHFGASPPAARQTIRRRTNARSLARSATWRPLPLALASGSICRPRLDWSSSRLLNGPSRSLARSLWVTCELACNSINIIHRRHQWRACKSATVLPASQPVSRPSVGRHNAPASGPQRKSQLVARLHFRLGPINHCVAREKCALGVQIRPPPTGQARLADEILNGAGASWRRRRTKMGAKGEDLLGWPAGQAATC